MPQPSGSCCMQLYFEWLRCRASFTQCLGCREAPISGQYPQSAPPTLQRSSTTPTKAGQEQSWHSKKLHAPACQSSAETPKVAPMGTTAPPDHVVTQTSRHEITVWLKQADTSMGAVAHVPGLPSPGPGMLAPPGAVPSCTSTARAQPRHVLGSLHVAPSSGAHAHRAHPPLGHFCIMHAGS